MDPLDYSIAQRASLWGSAEIPLVRYWIYLLLFFIHVFGKHPSYSAFQGVLAAISAIIVVHVISPFFRSTKEDLPILPWAFIQYYAFWVLPVFFEGESSNAVPFFALQQSDSVSLALLAVPIFMIAVLAGFRFGKNVWPASDRLIRPRPLPYNVLLLLATISLLTNSTILFFEGEGLWYFYLIFLLLSPLMIQLLMIFEINQFPNIYLITGYGVFVVISLLVGLASSRLLYVLMPLIAIILTHLSKTRTIKLSHLLCFFLILVMVNPAKLVYRKIVGFRTSSFSTVTVPEVMDAWIESFSASWFGASDLAKENLDGVIRRFNQLSINATVFYAVPDLDGYEYGKTWLPLFYTFIPRVVWENKPNITEVTNDYFNIKLGFQSPREVRTSTAPFPIISDGYLNFGWLGVFVVGVICGLYFSFLAHTFSPLKRFNYVIAFYLLVDLRSTAALVTILGGVAQAFLAVFLVVRLLEIRFVPKRLMRLRRR